MAGRGPAPKDPAERRRRNVDEPPKVVVFDGVVRGAELPDGLEWPEPTKAWWQTWRESPLAVTFTPTDWAFLLDTAVLHMEFWKGNHGVANELRLRSAKFGATPEDRARLKITVGEPSSAPPAAAPRRRAAPSRRSRVERILHVVDDAG